MRMLLIGLVLMCGCGERTPPLENYEGNVSTYSQNGEVIGARITFPKGKDGKSEIKNREEADRMLKQLDSLTKALKAARDQMPEPPPAPPPPKEKKGDDL